MTKDQRITRLIAEAESRQLSITEAARMLGRLNLGRKLNISDQDRERRRRHMRKIGKANRKGGVA
ncbi:MAG: hypothetical protein KGJ13_10385 [Patescibacteria group bacterium]|nr:hypothetical protein [Patescibacteria group bacterium]